MPSPYGPAQVPGSDGEIRPKLSPLAALARRDKLRTSKGSKDVNTFSVTTPANASAILAIKSRGDQQEELVVSWSSIIQRYVSHIYCGASDQEIRDGVAKDNPDPFPLAQMCSVQTVDDKDRRVALRGRKKVVADRLIAADQVIGIYEGEVLFEEEQQRTTNVMNRLSKEWKTFEYESMEKASYRIAIDDAQRLGITGDALYGTAIRYRNPLLVDGDKSVGAYAWATELNDFRTDPLNSLADEDPSYGPNITYIEVTIMNWPCIFIVANEDIPPGVELTLDYGSYWDGFRAIYRDQQIVQKTIANIVKPLVEHLDAIGDSVQHMFEKQNQLEHDLWTVKKQLKTIQNIPEKANLKEVESQYNCVVTTMRSRLKTYDEFLEPLSEATQNAPQASRLQSNIFGLACDEERRLRWTDNLKQAAGSLLEASMQMSVEARKSGSKMDTKASEKTGTAIASNSIMNLIQTPAHSRNTRAARHARAQRSNCGSPQPRPENHTPAPLEEVPSSSPTLEEPAPCSLESGGKQREQAPSSCGKGTSRGTVANAKRSKRSKTTDDRTVKSHALFASPNFPDDGVANIFSDLSTCGASRPLKKAKLETPQSLQSIGHVGEQSDELVDFCMHLLRKLVTMPDSEVFWDEVDIVAHPTYPQFVKEPMCFAKIKAGLQIGAYSSLTSFVRDISLIFANCRAFNEAGDDITLLAEKFEWAFMRDLTASVVFCPECSGLAFNTKCADCKKTFRRSQLSGVMNYHNIIKRLFTIENGSTIIARWYQNAIYYEARTVKPSKSKANTFKVDFLDGAKLREVHLNDLLLYPEPRRQEDAILSKGAKVLARMPSSLSEHNENNTFQPGIVHCASLKTVAVKFAYGRASALVDIPRSDVIVVDEAFFRKVVKDIADMAKGTDDPNAAHDQLFHKAELSATETPQKARLFAAKSATKSRSKKATSPAMVNGLSSKCKAEDSRTVQAEVSTPTSACENLGAGMRTAESSTPISLPETLAKRMDERLSRTKTSRDSAFNLHSEATSTSASSTPASAQAPSGSEGAGGALKAGTYPAAQASSRSSPMDLDKPLTPAFGTPLPVLSDMGRNFAITPTSSLASSAPRDSPIIIIDSHSDSEERYGPMRHSAPAQRITISLLDD
ncbi:Bromodomain adjacent to zinc finger domain protein 2B [Geranomyces michiganensis]|nr:Bromodomain adjacent to zinc finger domain protein 2B [Geranomyces michiganensis]